VVLGEAEETVGVKNKTV